LEQQKLQLTVPKGNPLFFDASNIQVTRNCRVDGSSSPNGAVGLFGPVTEKISKKGLQRSTAQ
jgi:hypothetical protein